MTLFVVLYADVGNIVIMNLPRSVGSRLQVSTEALESFLIEALQGTFLAWLVLFAILVHCRRWQYGPRDCLTGVLDEMLQFGACSLTRIAAALQCI